MNNGTDDKDLPVGTKRVCLGLEWKLYENQYGKYWRGGPTAINIRVNHERGGYSLDGRVMRYTDFEAAARGSMTVRKRDYEQAKKLVDEYEGH